MPALTAADAISILVATDNHVGYNERDPIRGDDSWKSFHEIMCLAKERDVDMVLLAGDLFHENKPSRKSMYNVMRSLRMNCYGEKPCELEMLSDGSEHFDGTFSHANFEDLDINVAIPVFSIHGNHDDPSGEGHLAALDILEMSGLINYYGRTPESDNISVKPVLLQKGRTKLALYGLSNVRDERLYRTFRDRKVRFFEPGTQTGDWFNILSVHQNRHAYTETSHLPENFLPNFCDLVVWGHEHECIINPRLNPEMEFKIMQPGSSVATSLIAGEAVPKHVAIVTVTGREFKSEPIRLKTVRPFIYGDISLAQEADAVRIAKKDNHRSELTRFLMEKVEELIEQAKVEWGEIQAERGTDEDEDGPQECPLPLIRLRVENTAPEGAGKFDCENPQRFSNRFIDRVANHNDVIQYIQRKKAPMRKEKPDEVDAEVMTALQGLDTVKVDKLVREFLAAQSLTILPQNYFSDAVGQFIDKDDKHAMELFVNDSLSSQMKHLVSLSAGGDADDDDEEESELATHIEEYRAQMEDAFAKGVLKKKLGKARFKPKPDNWDTDMDGEWEDQPGALLRPDEVLRNGAEDDDDDDDDDDVATAKTATRGRGRGRGGRGAASATARKPVAKKAPAKRGKKVVESDEEDEEEDIVMLDDDDDDEEEDDENSQAMFFRDTKTNRTRAKPATKTSTAGRKAAAPIRRPPPRPAAAKGKQTSLQFTNSQASVLGSARGKTQSQSLGDDIDDDDDDAFEPMPSVKTRARR